MANSIQHKRREAMFLKAISSIISEEVKNVYHSYPTVTGVKLANDSSHLVIYLAFTKNPKQNLEALEKAKGFVRAKLKKLPNLRKIPTLDFKLDQSWEEGHRIEEILAKIKKS